LVGNFEPLVALVILTQLPEKVVPNLLSGAVVERLIIN
jgi:hypothetical protein